MAVCFSYQHRGNVDPVSSAVVAHDDVLDVLEAVVNNNGKCASRVLYVSHLLDECAVATHDKVDWRRIGVWVALGGSHFELVAAQRLVGIVENAAEDGVAIGDNAEVGFVRLDFTVSEYFIKLLGRVNGQFAERKSNKADEKDHYCSHFFLFIFTDMNRVYSSPF